MIKDGGAYDILYASLVADMNPVANSRVVSAYPGATPIVFFDAGYRAMVGGFSWDNGDGGYALVPFYETEINATGVRAVPAVDVVTAIDWLGDYVVRVHVAVAHGVDANTAPSIPSTPVGPVRFRSGETQVFETDAADAEDNLLSYQWNWGDGEISDWLGPFDAGVKAAATHSWAANGHYDVQVKVKDPFGEETDWSTALAVTVNCCLGRVGDANGLGGDEPTIGDVSVMIDAKFITGACSGILECSGEADINQSGGLTPDCGDVTIGDVSFLIDYLFITGPTLGLPDCL